MRRAGENIEVGMTVRNVKWTKRAKFKVVELAPGFSARVELRQSATRVKHYRFNRRDLVPA